ncbi:MAG: hypothetical protein H7249_20630 [Chitinophagaceae bacterium]|nr:hypothetical protein [Oligoflexus sp.]
MTFTDYTGLGLSVPAAQYFQYRVFMESDEYNLQCTYASAAANCSPELKTVALGTPLHYPANNPPITTALATAVSYYNVATFAETGSSVCADTAKYALSRDNASWYYWNGSAWTTSNGTYTQAATAALISSNAATFRPQVGSGTLYVRTFLHSNGVNNCTIDDVTVTGNQGP